jgi:hypothetical protein
VLVAKEFEHVAVKSIAARLGREIDDAAVEPPEFGRWAIALDLELLDGVDHGVVRHLPRLRLQHGDAVEEILVRSRPSPVDARQRGIRRQRDARNDGREHDEEAAVQRQLHDLLVLDDRPEARGLRPHDWRVRDHRHLFLNTSDCEIEIDARLLTGCQTDALATHRLEARQFDIQAVLARRQAGCGVEAVACRDDDSMKIRPHFRDGDGRAGNRSTSLILYEASDLAGGRLRPRGQHADDARARDGESD